MTLDELIAVLKNIRSFSPHQSMGRIEVKIDDIQKGLVNPVEIEYTYLDREGAKEPLVIIHTEAS